MSRKAVPYYSRSESPLSAKLVGSGIVGYHTNLDSRILFIGALAYAGAITPSSFELLVHVYIPPSLPVLFSLPFTAVAVVTTALGLVAKGSPGFLRSSAIMLLGFFLGIFGVIGWAMATIDNEHTLDVCAVSKVLTSNPYGQWACPQVQASNAVVWISALGLLIPAILFLAVPFLTLRQEHRPQSNPVA